MHNIQMLGSVHLVDTISFQILVAACMRFAVRLLSYSIGPTSKAVFFFGQGFGGGFGISLCGMLLKMESRSTGLIFP